MDNSATSAIADTQAARFVLYGFEYLRVMQCEGESMVMPSEDGNANRVDSITTNSDSLPNLLRSRSCFPVLLAWRQHSRETKATNVEPASIFIWYSKIGLCSTLTKAFSSAPPTHVHA